MFQKLLRKKWPVAAVARRFLCIEAKYINTSSKLRSSSYNLCFSASGNLSPESNLTPHNPAQTAFSEEELYEKLADAVTPLWRVSIYTGCN